MSAALARVKAYLNEHQRRSTAPRSTMDKETIHALGLGAEIIKLTTPDLMELVARVEALELSRAICANDLEDAIRDSYDGVWAEEDIQNHIARHMAPLERLKGGKA